MLIIFLFTRKFETYLRPAPIDFSAVVYCSILYTKKYKWRRYSVVMISEWNERNNEFGVKER